MSSDQASSITSFNGTLESDVYSVIQVFLLIYINMILSHFPTSSRNPGRLVRKRAIHCLAE